MFEVKGLPLGQIGACKKGGFVRKFLVRTSEGNDVLTVYGRSADSLSGSAERVLKVRPGDLVFLVEPKPDSGKE